MDIDKKIRILLSENEFLQLQLEDINLVLKKKGDEIDMLSADMETEAFLRSKIEGNLTEIAQLKFDNQQTTEKSDVLQTLNEELEVDLLRQIKGRQKEQRALKEMDSVKANFEVITAELTEAAALYKMIQLMREKLSEAKSIASLTQMENQELKKEIQEQRELLALLRLKKLV